jgi:hypothetical protein
MTKISVFIVLLALLLVSPVAAYAADDGFVNKYHDYNPLLTADSGTGMVFFHIRAGGSAQDLNITVSRDNKSTTYTVNPDGNYDTRLVPGEFTALLKRGNADQPEWQNFTVYQQARTDVVFLGDAVSSVGEGRPYCAPGIVGCGWCSRWWPCPFN